MAIDVTFYTHDKRNNSTLRPTGEGETITGNLNDVCDIVNPSILFHQGPHITLHNYAYIPKFKRYYFITNWSWQLGLWRADLEVDVLASWKDEIGEQTHYITRSSAASNGNVVDNLFPILPSVGILRSAGDRLFSVRGKYYIIQYTGENGVNCDWISGADFTALCAALWLEWDSIEGMTDLYYAALDPMQYLLGVQQTPAPYDFFEHTGAGEIALGGVKTGITGIHLTGATITSRTCSVPKHPGATARPWLKSSPYSEYSIYIPGCGWIPLSANDLYNADSVTVNVQGEPFSGTLRADVVVQGATIASATGRCSNPWSLSSSSPNIGGVASGLTSTAVNAVKGNFVGMLGGIGSTVGACMPTVTTNGGTGGSIGLEEQIQLVMKYQNAATDNNEEHGRPLMAKRQIKTLGGYIQCDSADFEGPALRMERIKIDAFLNGGFYYE